MVYILILLLTHIPLKKLYVTPLDETLRFTASKIHIIGINGIGMSALAIYLKNKFDVSGVILPIMLIQ